MLQYIRDRATGWIATAIIGLLIIPFALWGIYDYFTPSQNQAVAVVNDVELSLQRYNQLYQQRRFQVQSMLGDSYRPDLINEEFLRQQVLDQMINDELVIQSGLTHRMRVGDGQLVGAIRSLPIFERTGGFSQDQYENFLRTQGYSPTGFEFDLRRSILMEQFSEAMGDAALVPEAAVDRAMRLSGQQRTVRVLEVPGERFADVEIAPSEVERRYQARRAGYVTPEQVSLRYVVLDRRAVAAEVSIDPAELESAYELRKEGLTAPEQRRASHILVNAPLAADEAALAAARDEVEGLVARLEAGESFEALAREHSDDPGSAAQGGDLGWFGRSVMDPQFEETVFSMDEGDVSDPVRTRFGLHVIKLTGIRAPRVKAFEEVRPTIEAELRADLAEQIFADRVDQLATIAFEQADSLEPAANALGLEIGTTPMFSREGDPGGDLTAHPRIIETAFSGDVLVEGNNSPLIEIDSDRVAVARVDEHRPVGALSLDEARERIVAELRAEAAAERARGLGTELVRRLREGEEPAAVAAANSLQWGEPVEVDRLQSGLAPAVIDAVFRMPRPAGEARIFDGVAGDGGDYFVLGLEAVSETVEESAPERTQAVRSRLANDYGSAELRALVDSLRARSEVVTSGANLELR